MLAIDAALHEAVRGFEKIVAVKLRVESKDGASHQAVDEFLSPGTDSESLGVRPGDVPKRDDRRLWQSIADHPRQQGEMIVLHEHDRIIAGRLLKNHVSEPLVYLPVLSPVLLSKSRADKCDVAKWP